MRARALEARRYRNATTHRHHRRPASCSTCPTFQTSTADEVKLWKAHYYRCSRLRCWITAAATVSHASRVSKVRARITPGAVWHLTTKMRCLLLPRGVSVDTCAAGKSSTVTTMVTGASLTYRCRNIEREALLQWRDRRWKIRTSNRSKRAGRRPTILSTRLSIRRRRRAGVSYCLLVRHVQPALLSASAMVMNIILRVLPLQMTRGLIPMTICRQPLVALGQRLRLRVCNRSRS